MGARGQSGTVLVEVLIAMAVTSLVLLGLSSVVFVGSNAYQAWAAPIEAAQAGPPLEILAASIQSDTHRLVPCTVSSGTNLDLCYPNLVSGGCQQVVRYTSRGNGATRVELVRQSFTPPSCGLTSQVIVLRDLSSTPWFAVSNCSAAPTSSAVITVSGITYAGSQAGRQLSLFGAAPATSGWSC